MQIYKIYKFDSDFVLDTLDKQPFKVIKLHNIQFDSQMCVKNGQIRILAITAPFWSFIIQQVPLLCSYFKFEERNKAGNSIIRHRTLTDNCQLSLSHSQICVQSLELYMVCVLKLHEADTTTC